MRASQILSDIEFLSSAEYDGLDFRDARDLADECEEVLNDTHDDVVICGMTFLAGAVLRKVDPIAFREQFLGWLDVEGWVETAQGFVAGEALADAYEAFTNQES